MVPGLELEPNTRGHAANHVPHLTRPDTHISETPTTLLSSYGDPCTRACAFEDKSLLMADHEEIGGKNTV